MKKDERHLVLDTSCIVPLLCGWHEHHLATASAVDAYLNEGFELALAAHSLVESYSVLTRFPAPNRLSPDAALELLDKNFRKTAIVLGLTARETWQLLGRAPSLGVAGGRAYDALIAASARKAASPLLLTWNLKHFAAFEGPELTVSTPATPAVH